MSEAAIEQQVDLSIEEVHLVDAQPPMTSEEQQKALLKAGILTSTVALFGILNPPTTTAGTMTDAAATTTTTTTTSTGIKAHRALSAVFSTAAYASLATGALQTLLAVAIRKAPQLKPAAILSKEVGLALVRFTLGYGASLVLLMAASPWFVLHIMFLSLHFM